MMKYLVLAASLFSLAACDDVKNAVDHTAREGTRVVVAEALATRFPQVPKEKITPFTDCVIQYASAKDIRTFARARVSGIDEATVQIIRATLGRPETRACIGRAVLS